MRELNPRRPARCGAAASVLLIAACGRSDVLVATGGGGGDAGGDADGLGEYDGGWPITGDADTEEDPPDCDLDSHSSDCDGDGVPDADDPFPTDTYRPGRAREDVIYVHSAFTLSSLAPESAPIVTTIADFSFPDDSFSQVTDIAIDRFGVLYALGSDVLHACDPSTAQCWALAPVPSNSLAFLPLGTLDADDDTLVTLAGSAWTRIDLRGPEVAVTVIGEIEAPYSSSGDITTTFDGLTVFTSPSVTGVDLVLALDPVTGTVFGVIGLASGLSNVWGMASVRGALWLFDQVGNIATMDPISGEVVVVGFGLDGFWGAASHPDLR